MLKPRGQIIRPQPHSFCPRPRSHGIWSHRNWPRMFTVYMTLINIHNIAIDNHFCCVWLLTENYVLNANILVFMLIHTELFSNVSGLGLEKIFGPWPCPHSFWPRPHAQLASLTSLILYSKVLYCIHWMIIWAPNSGHGVSSVMLICLSDVSTWVECY